VSGRLYLWIGCAPTSRIMDVRCAPTIRCLASKSSGTIPVSKNSFQPVMCVHHLVTAAFSVREALWIRCLRRAGYKAGTSLVNRVELYGGYSA